MGFWSSVGSAISSAISAVCSGVGRAVSALGSFAMTYGPTILGNLAPVTRVFGALAQMLGIFKSNEDIEDMGDRAIQAGEAGIQMEKYSNYDEYMTAIRNFELDPEKSKEIDKDKKLLTGIGLASKGIEDKFDLPEGTGGILATMVALNSAYFTEKRLDTWLKSDSIDVGTMISYFDNKLGPADNLSTVESIIKTEKTISSSKSDMEIYKEVVAAKDMLNDN